MEAIRLTYIVLVKKRGKYMYYGGCYQVGGYSSKFNYEFVLLVVLFILLIIVGACFCK